MSPKRPTKRRVQLVASGDLRLSANQVCWPAQAAMEQALTAALNAEGVGVARAHPYRPKVKHGFIASQREGIEVFRDVDPDAPLIVAEAVWQYSHHVLAGLTTHRGPILTVANWSGQWPGLVGHAESQRLADQGRREVLHAVERGLHRRLLPHEAAAVAEDAAASSTTLARASRSSDVEVPARGREARRSGSPQSSSRDKAIMGVFDEGCMGMFNAIIPDDAAARVRCLQGTPEPVGALSRDDAGRATTRPLPCARGWSRTG